jgi:hypothetical protein
MSCTCSVLFLSPRFDPYVIQGLPLHLFSFRTDSHQGNRIIGPPAAAVNERFFFADERGIEKVVEGYEEIEMEMEMAAKSGGYLTIMGALHSAMRNLGRRRGRGGGEEGIRVDEVPCGPRRVLIMTWLNQRTQECGAACTHLAMLSGSQEQISDLWIPVQRRPHFRPDYCCVSVSSLRCYVVQKDDTRRLYRL